MSSESADKNFDFDIESNNENVIHLQTQIKANLMEKVEIYGDDYKNPELNKVSLLYAEGHTLDGKMIGDWKEYYSNDDVASGMYLNGEKHGEWKSQYIVQN